MGSRGLVPNKTPHNLRDDWECSSDPAANNSGEKEP